MTATTLPPNTVAPHLSIKLKLTPKAPPVPEAEPVVAAAAPCVAACGDPNTCARLYAGWIFKIGLVDFDPLVDFLPNAAFTLRIIPGPSTELCPGALFDLNVDSPLSTYLFYGPGTDPADYTDDFSLTFDSTAIEFALTATGVGDYNAAVVSFGFQSAQSVCEPESATGLVYEFGPSITCYFVTAP